MTSNRFRTIFFSLIVLSLSVGSVYAQLSEEKAAAEKWITDNEQTLKAVNQKIWNLAELGLQEYESSKTLINLLRQHGFEIKSGVADMPTAFVATYGSGEPMVAILAEYDALPGISQKTIPNKEPQPGMDAGHGCGHCLFGTASTAAAIAARYAMEQHQLKGTIRLYGCPAEETCIGKVYMARAGLFDDCDAALHWHPKGKNYSSYGSSKAMTSVKFTFKGVSAHAAASPEGGRSALDAVELMNIGVNFMREHTAEDTRMHYVIIDGGKAPNVVPPLAKVWYFVRADKHRDMRAAFERVLNIAKGAALMTDTTVEWYIDTDACELLPNWPLAELVDKNLHLVGPPQFTEAEKEFARKSQEALEKKCEFALSEKIEPLTKDYVSGKGSTDVGNVSWVVPTGGMSAVCYPYDIPTHSWQVVACSGMSIGEKGMMTAARTLAYSTVELFTDPEWIEKAKADFEERKAGEEIVSLIPEGQKAPVSIK